ncbi:hypothetical protein [Lentibacillus salicampi]|uniref:hypothetical protein n=1 Tax=Lentibacillus salicampi TaxID=175306 RepID=UPI0014313AA1|nr:hypothetical protein [Lentibacillus salicampi]
MKKAINTIVLICLFVSGVYVAARLLNYEITFMASMFSMGGLAYLLASEVADHD